MGVPMVAVTIPLFFTALIPIIIIEAVIVKSILGSSFGNTIRSVTFANIYTTVIGLPLSNIIAFLIALLARALPVDWFGPGHTARTTLAKATLGSYWYDPNLLKLDDLGHLIRPFPQEPFWYFILILCVALFINLFVSIILEYSYMRKTFPNSAPELRKAAIWANSASYLFLVLTVVIIGFVKGR